MTFELVAHKLGMSAAAEAHPAYISPEQVAKTVVQPRILCPAGGRRHSVLVDPPDVALITAVTNADTREP